MASMHFDTSSVVSSAVFSSCLRGFGRLRRPFICCILVLEAPRKKFLNGIFFWKPGRSTHTQTRWSADVSHWEWQQHGFWMCSADCRLDETWRTDPCEKHPKNWPQTWIQNFGWLAADSGLNPLAAARPALVLWSGTFLGSYVVNRVLPTRLVECSNFKCRSGQYYEHCSRSIVPRELKKN